MDNTRRLTDRSAVTLHILSVAPGPIMTETVRTLYRTHYDKGASAQDVSGYLRRLTDGGWARLEGRQGTHQAYTITDEGRRALEELKKVITTKIKILKRDCVTDLDPVKPRKKRKAV